MRREQFKSLWDLCISETQEHHALHKSLKEVWDDIERLVYTARWNPDKGYKLTATIRLREYLFAVYYWSLKDIQLAHKCMLDLREYENGLMKKKQDEYASDTDVFSNFKAVQQFACLPTKEDALWSLASKQFVCVRDDLCFNKRNKDFTDEYVKEKIVACRTYVAIYFAMLMDKNKKEESC